MNKPKLTSLLVSCALIGAGIFAGFGMDKSTDVVNYSIGSANRLLRFESLNGISEFYLRPVGDNRIWHIISRYISLKRGKGPDCNTATYTFSKDSVNVINDFVVAPSGNMADVNLSRFNNITLTL